MLSLSGIRGRQSRRRAVALEALDLHHLPLLQRQGEAQGQTSGWYIRGILRVRNHDSTLFPTGHHPCGAVD